MSPAEVVAGRLREIRKRLARIRLYCVFQYPEQGYDRVGIWDDPLMAEHLEWQLALEDQGILFAAGPLQRGENADAGLPHGMYLIAATDIAAACELAAQEPFVRQGLRRFEVVPFMLNEGVGRVAAERVSARIMES